MLNPFTVVIDYLLTQSTLTDIVGTRISAGVDLPEGTDLNDGPAIVCNTRGGDQDYANLIHDYSFQFLCYAIDSVAAMDVAVALYAVLNQTRAEPIKWAEQDIEPQIAQESAADWPFALVFYTITIREAT